MTLTDIQGAIWNNIGKPTDLNPATDTQYGGGPLLTWVANEGQRQVAVWKDPATGTHLRFHRLKAELYFQSTLLDETLDDNATSTTQVVLPAADVGTQDDRYNGWVLEVSGAQRVIVDYVGATRTATVHSAYGTAPVAGDSYRLYKRFWYLLPSTHAWAADHITLPEVSDRYLAEGNLYEILKVVDLEQECEVEKGPRQTAWPDFTLTASGDAGEWRRFGNKLAFDANIDEARWYNVEYYRLPTDMSSATDEPEIPETFHHAITLWGTWWGHTRRMEMSDAYAAKRTFEDYMRTHRTEFDVSDERGDGQMILRRE